MSDANEGTYCDSDALVPLTDTQRTIVIVTHYVSVRVFSVHFPFRDNSYEPFLDCD